MRRKEYRRLPVEAEDRAVDVRLLQQHAGVVGQVARREVVGAVDDDIVGREDRQCVGRGQPRLVQVEAHLGVDGGDAVPGRLELGPADVGGAVDDLPLQVAEIDHVEIDQADAADARGRQI